MQFHSCRSTVFRVSVLAIFLLKSFLAYSQEPTGVVRGLVQNSSTNEPLPGVSIVVKNTITNFSSGTSTDSSGVFGFTRLPAGRSFSFIISAVGYESQTLSGYSLKAENITSLIVKLNLSSESLDQVVVIGYGTQQKKDLTGSVGLITAAQTKNLPVPSVDQRMVGQVAGMQVSAATGIPGGGTSIRIRGAGSIGAGNDPLFVIDGFPITRSFGQTSNPLNLINPDDIESITILKDASSTAIYGSRGSNGVVVVTTKKGRSGPPTVEISAYTGWQTVPEKGRPTVLNGTEYAQYQREWITDYIAFQGRVATDADIPQYLRNPAQYGEGTNWYKEILHTAPQSSVNASVSGGSENSRYSFSLGRVNQDGVVRYTGFERYAARINFEVNLSRKLKLGFILAPSNSIQRLSDSEGSLYRDNIIVRSLWLSPLVSVKDATGKRVPFIEGGGRPAPNPLNSLEFAGTKRKEFRGLKHFC